MAVTISDIAKEAGVSTATVSRMMNQSGYVSDKAREKVEHAIKKLNYTPNAAARSLSTKESKVIGVMVPEISNPFFGEVIEGISQIADEAGYALMLFDTSESVVKELRALQMLRQQDLCGLILTPVIDVCANNLEFYACLEQLKIPVVLLDREVEGLNLSGVYCDNVEGAYKLTMALLDGDYRSIAVMAGDQNLKLGRDRLEGFMRAMRFSNRPVSSENVLFGAFKKETAKAVLLEYIEKSNLPEAIFSCNNAMTEGVIDALSELNLLEKVALASYDALSWSKYLRLNIIQLERNTREMGQRATKTLLKELDTTQNVKKTKTIIETHLLSV